MEDDSPDDGPDELPSTRLSASGEVLGQFSWGLVIVFTLASICWGLVPYTGPYFSAVVFLMAVVLAGTQWRRAPVLAMAVVSALIWNFVFIPPRFTLHIENPQDAVMFGLFFVVGLSMGHLTTRLHAREEELRRHHRERESLVAAKHRAEMIAESERLHRILLDSVSHELKSPITIIRTALDGLDPKNPLVIEVDAATHRLQRIVENFLQMTRIESEGLTLRPDWWEFTDVIQAATLSLDRELTSHPLQVHGVAALPLLHLDGRLLAQAIGLVLHNAAQYSPAQTPIDLDASLNQGWLIVRVRDHGPGIPSWALDRIFEKFYRSPSAPAGGTGLGLAIARGLMRALDGTIQAANHPEGGAQFTLRLPVIRHPETTAP
ncbi:MAG: DUF4118 domain-containing protein [Verrucomicrobiales bacterium]